MIVVTLPVAGSARASPDGVSTHTAGGPGTMCGVYLPLPTRRLWVGLSERRSIKVMRSTPAQPIQVPCGLGNPAQASSGAGIGAAFPVTWRDGPALDR